MQPYMFVSEAIYNRTVHVYSGICYARNPAEVHDAALKQTIDKLPGADEYKINGVIAWND